MADKTSNGFMPVTKPRQMLSHPELLLGHWAPFLIACLGRITLLTAMLLLVDGMMLGMAPDHLRPMSYMGVAACILGAFAKYGIGRLVAGPTPDMQVTTEVGAFRSDTVVWVASGMRGWRPQMEDSHVAVMLDPTVFQDAALFAVLDGHGGWEVSELASKLLAKEVNSCGRAQTSKKGDGGPAPSLEEALRKALPNLDAKIRAGSFGLGRVFPVVLHPFAATGSTACVAAVDFESREVLVANIGDSRAVLVRNGKAVALSEDHKPENPEERARIRAAGGQVVKVGPCHRVDGNLNLSRALGDFNLKANFSLPAEKQKVSAFPDFTRTPFNGGPEEVLVVACDGLFERCSNQDLADLIWPRLKRGLGLGQIAKELLHACCARSCKGMPIEMGTDNETVVLVKLPAKIGSEALADGLRAGQRVQIHGLESEAGQSLNGLMGILEGKSHTEGRLDVCLSSGGGDVKSFKGANLRAVSAGGPSDTPEL